MILLDTNVLSVVIGFGQDFGSRAWLDAQAPEDMWTTSLTLCETSIGLARMPQGRRRALLEKNLKATLADGLERRIVPFDGEAAMAAAELEAERRARGFVVGLADTLIAGIALSRRATLATRNLRHFADLKTPVVDPWAA